MVKFNISTLGCKVNQYESETLSESLQRSGWELVQTANPDLYIVNTCAVTQKAAMQSRQMIRRAIKNHPNARILVTGCYAQTDPEALRKISGITYVAGNAAKNDIPGVLSRFPEGLDILNSSNGFDLTGISSFKDLTAAAAESRTRPYLKIQDGCDAFCSYCIVPYARGRSRSMPLENVIENITRLAKTGSHEVVLCGVHIGRYGLDLTPRTSLFELLKLVETKALIDRIRLSSIEPVEITDNIIKLAAGAQRICPHFHIPLQSGDDSILERMGRPYTSRFYKDLILKIHTVMPEAAIGMDVLVGFPGETDQAFQNTYRLIEELPVSYLHVFPFSARKGTAADRMPDKVSYKVIKSRCQDIRLLGAAKKKTFYSRFVGRTLSVLIEGKSTDNDNGVKGLSTNYIPVSLNDKDNLKNGLAKVRIESIGTDNSVFGRFSDN